MKAHNISSPLWESFLISFFDAAQNLECGYGKGMVAEGDVQFGEAARRASALPATGEGSKLGVSAFEAKCLGHGEWPA
jgi:hypothetical protein